MYPKNSAGIPRTFNDHKISLIVHKADKAIMDFHYDIRTEHQVVR